MSSRTFKSPHRPLPAPRGAGLKPWSLASPSPTGGARKIGGIAQSSFLQALRSAPIAPSSCCSGTQSAGLGKMSPRRRSRWTMMTRVAAILRAPPQKLCTPTAPGSVTFAKKLTDQVPTSARPTTLMVASAQGTAVPPAALPPSTRLPLRWMWMRPLSARNGGPISLPQRAGDGVVGGPEQKLVEVSMDPHLWRMEPVLPDQVLELQYQAQRGLRDCLGMRRLRQRPGRQNCRTDGRKAGPHAVLAAQEQAPRKRRQSPLPRVLAEAAEAPEALPGSLLVSSLCRWCHEWS